MIVTGIGSRSIPLEANGNTADWLLEIVRELGQLATTYGWTLRSGGAEGMDSLFEALWGHSKEIFIPWNGFNGHWDTQNGSIFINDPVMLAKAEAVVSKVHPYWSKMKRGAKALHTRNVFQALGQFVDEPSDICIFWAPVDEHGDIKGGTRTAVEICRNNGVPTFNLNITTDRYDLRQHIECRLAENDTIHTIQF